MSLAKLKKNRKSNLDKINQEIENMKTGGGNRPRDERYWSVERDKAGNGSAVIRFLPAPDGEGEIPWVKLFTHGFQGPSGKWYIENSRSTLNEDDPVYEMNRKLYQRGEQGDEEAKKFVSKSKRKLNFISNIYVVSDSAHPENEGKVFLFRYGRKIFEKLQGKMYPEFDDEVGIDPTCFWDGANFKLRVRMLDGWPNYDKCEFAESSPIFDNDEDIEKVYKQLHSLKGEVAENKFKSYDELKNRLNQVLDVEDTPKPSAPKEETPAQKKSSAPKENEVPFDTDEDEDDMEFFKNLAED